MQQVVREGVTNKGTAYVIRYPTQEDVQSTWAYINKLSKERTFIRFQGEEIPLEVEKQFIADRLKRVAEHTSVTLFLVVDGEVKGICGADQEDKTESHVASLGLSVDESVRGQGLGKALMGAVLEEAEKHIPGLRIFSLKVKEPNGTAFSLYEKLGFKQYGLLPKGTQHQGEFVDEILMYREAASPR